jgi:hypothetical protein
MESANRGAERSVSPPQGSVLLGAIPDALLHFAGGLVGERHAQDLIADSALDQDDAMAITQSCLCPRRPDQNGAAHQFPPPRVADSVFKSSMRGAV